VEVATITPRGFNRDLQPAETGPGVYNEAQNVIFNDGFAASPPGWLSTPGTLLCQPLWILPFTHPDGDYYWIYAGNNDAGTAGVLAVTDGVTHWDITHASGQSVTSVGDWTGGVLNGVPVMNNPQDDPMWWDGNTANAVTTLTGWPASTKCKALRPFKFHLLAMNITQSSVEYPDWILHSDAADPGAIPASWTAGPSTQAGSFSISTVTGGIVDGAELRDIFVVYKQGSNAIIQYTGSSFFFSTRRVFVSTGMLAPNCAQELAGQHYMITDGDIVRHNGQQVESLVDGALRNWVFDQLSSTYQAAHVAISHSNKQVWFNFPTNGEYCDLSLVWDINSESMGMVSYAPFSYMARGVLGDLASNAWSDQTDTWDTVVGTWNAGQANASRDTLLFARYTEKELNYLSGFLRNGAESACKLQLLSKDLDHPTAYKTIDRVYINGEGGSYGLNEVITGRIGSQESPNDDITWSPSLSLYRDKSLSYGVAGRYISLELNLRQRADWRINSIDVHYSVSGQ
jgi:hypothetical protein